MIKIITFFVNILISNIFSAILSLLFLAALIYYDMFYIFGYLGILAAIGLYKLELPYLIEAFNEKKLIPGPGVKLTLFLTIYLTWPYALLRHTINEIIPQKTKEIKNV